MLCRLRNMFVALLTVGGMALILFSLWVVMTVRAPGPLVEETLAHIKPGSSVRGIAQQLTTLGAVESPTAFFLWARLQNEREGLKAGEYALPPRASGAEIIALLQSGKTHQRKLTIPEGLTVTEIADILRAEDALTGDLGGALPPEGSLLPETYNFSYGDTRASLLARMQDSMRETLAELWPQRAEGLPVKTPEEAVTLASIVEKETGIASERPRVAGVFTNRLNRRMPLQSDPTVIYALTRGQKKMERMLFFKDLKTPSPYNTYMVPGLPPGPIANPGRESLTAVLHPEAHDYLYFVADGTGGHAFSKTLKEHNANVSQWRKINKNQ